MTAPAQEALASIGMSGEELQKQIQSGQKTYFEVIQEISAKTNEFGIGSQEAGMILADVFKGAGEDAGQFIFSLDKLNLSLDDMEDTSQGMDAALGNLTRSFYEFMFGVNDAGGVTDKFAGVIQFLADNLGTILTTLVKLIAIYGVYKGTIVATNLAQKAYTAGVALLTAAKGLLTGKINVAEKAMKVFNATTKANPIGLLITLLATAVTAFLLFRDGVNDAKKAQEDLNEAIKKGADEGIEAGQKIVSETKKQTER